MGSDKLSSLGYIATVTVPFKLRRLSAQPLYLDKQAASTSPVSASTLVSRPAMLSVRFDAAVVHALQSLRRHVDHLSGLDKDRKLLQQLLDGVQKATDVVHGNSSKEVSLCLREILSVIKKISRAVQGMNAMPRLVQLLSAGDYADGLSSLFSELKNAMGPLSIAMGNTNDADTQKLQTQLTKVKLSAMKSLGEQGAKLQSELKDALRKADSQTDKALAQLHKLLQAYKADAELQSSKGVEMLLLSLQSEAQRLDATKQDAKSLLVDQLINLLQVVKQELQQKDIQQKDQRKTLTPDQLSAAPEAFLCWITQDVMVEPVMARSGHTYERKAIVTWILQNGTDPVTREPVAVTDLVPNRNLQKAIEDWRAKQLEASTAASGSKPAAKAKAPAARSSSIWPDLESLMPRRKACALVSTRSISAPRSPASTPRLRISTAAALMDAIADEQAGPVTLDLTGSTIVIPAADSPRVVRIKRRSITITNGSITVPAGGSIEITAPDVTLSQLKIEGSPSAVSMDMVRDFWLHAPANNGAHFGVVNIRAPGVMLKECTVRMAPAPPGHVYHSTRSWSCVCVGPEGVARISQCFLLASAGSGLTVHTINPFQPASARADGTVTSGNARHGFCSRGYGSQLKLDEGCFASECLGIGYLARDGGKLAATGCKSRKNRRGFCAVGSGAVLEASNSCSTHDEMEKSWYKVDGGQIVRVPA